MTSRSSFFKLLKEDFRRRLWTFILSVLVEFGIFGIAFTMYLQAETGYMHNGNLTQLEYIERVSGDICDFIALHPLYMLVAAVGAVICGISGFAYLHSKKQTDFYHSLPVKKETLFAVRFVTGLLIYAVPYLAGLVYAVILSAVFGVLTANVWLAAGWCFLMNLMGYTIMYLATILAMILTGKLVIGFFGIAVFSAYAPAIFGLIELLKEAFFVSSYFSSVDIEDALFVTRWFSPVSYYYALAKNVANGGEKFWLEMLTFVVLAAVLVALILVLYKKRPSEKADTAMSFEISEPIIRILISVPVGILLGMLFLAFKYDNRTVGSGFGWLIFGSALGAFLAHGIIESLYRGDVKKCISKKRQMALTVGLAVVTPLLFYFDVFGFDSYIPKKEEIAHMAMFNHQMRFSSGYFDEEGNWITERDYVMENMKVTDVEAMYELASAFTTAVKENRTSSFFGYDNYAVTTSDSVYGTEYNHTQFILKYTLKNGKEVYREYYCNYYAILDMLEAIYNNDEFKKASNPVYSILDNPGLKLLGVSAKAPQYPAYVDIKNPEQLLQVYAEDFLKLSFDTLRTTAAVGELRVRLQAGKTRFDIEDYYEEYSTLLVYPGMTRTIELLCSQGIYMDDTAADRAKSITVRYNGTLADWLILMGKAEYENMPEYDSSMGFTEDEYYLYMDKYYETYGFYPEEAKVTVIDEEYHEITVEITDPAEIAECMEHMVYREYRNEFGNFPLCFSHLNADVYFDLGEAYGEDGIIGWTENYRFLKDEVPQFVLDRIEAELYGRNTEGSSIPKEWWR